MVSKNGSSSSVVGQVHKNNSHVGTDTSVECEVSGQQRGEQELSSRSR